MSYARSLLRRTSRTTMTTRTIARQLGALLDDATARVEASLLGTQYRTAFEELHFGSVIQRAPDIDVIALSGLVWLSDTVLDLATPCRRVAAQRRRHGIVRNGDGYPIVTPAGLVGSPWLLGRLVDEREYLVIPCRFYRLRDWEGDLHTRIGPAGDCGDGRMSGEVARAFLRIGLSKLYKHCECLKERDRRGRYAGWDYPTRMPGLVGAGTKDDIEIEVAELLRVHYFGPPPSAPDDEPPTSTVAPLLPPLPLRATPVFDIDQDEHRGLLITEMPLPQGRATEVSR